MGVSPKQLASYEKAKAEATKLKDSLDKVKEIKNVGGVDKFIDELRNAGVTAENVDEEIKKWNLPPEVAE
jgi:hypothetical protein